MPPRRTVNEAKRVHVMLDEVELAAVDDYFHAARLRSRSEAIRELIAKGLAVHKAQHDPKT